jgi:hypothetical protein
MSPVGVEAALKPGAATATKLRFSPDPPRRCWPFGRLRIARFRARENFLDRKVDQIAAVFPVEFEKPPYADKVCIALRLQLAEHLIRQSHIAQDELQEVLIEFPLAMM